MSKEIYISSTPHETRLAIVENDELTEIYYERENEYTLAGSIYNGKVTRVLPGMQSSFVDVGLERDAFLYITDFMEEAGDSADFDTSENRGRSDSRRGDRGRSDHAGVPQDRSLGAGEPLSIENGLRNDASGEMPSSDRGDRGRRRGRGGNRDLQPRETLPSAEPSSHDDQSLGPVTTNSPEIHEAGDEASLGEGAPGADGSRRWRGRRGRRRGRSGTPESSSAGPVPAAKDDASLAELPADPSSGYDLADTFEPTNLEASGQPSDPHSITSPESESTVPAQFFNAASSSAPQEEKDLDSPESGDRGRRQGRGRGRDRRDDRPRAPRGFAPSTALYGVEENADQFASDGRPPEPIILPGESLSKYRKGAEASASFQPAPAAPLAPEFTLPGAWDGGSVLPGETLRPRSASSLQSQSDGRRNEGRGDRDRHDLGRRDGRSEGRRHESGPRREDRGSSFPVPSVASFREPAPVEQDLDGLTIATPPEATVLLAEVAPETAPPLQESPSSGAQEPASETPADFSDRSTPAETEYEPSEGSASHRFDPVPPREFRQPAPEAEAVMEPAPTPEPETPPAAEAASLTHSITPPAGSSLTPIHRDDEAYGGTVLPTGEAPAAHDLTSISSDGEMLSQVPPPPPAQEITEPTSPLQHETVILHAGAADHAEADEVTIVEPETIPAAMAAAPPEISGEADDLIIEELSQESETEGDEEDFRTTLHAASIEEMDYEDGEEETLEGAADLGTMLREMSIDQITQTGEPALADDEDDFSFEEEDTTEDTDLGDASREVSTADTMGFSEADFAGDRSLDDLDVSEPSSATGEVTSSQEEQRNDRRRGGRRDNRRGGRDRERGGDRSRFTTSSAAGNSTAAERERSSGSRPGRRDGHRSAQTTNLPAISDLLKPGQEVLVQIAKEPIAKKGARITSHIALPGRFLVFMPTVNHTGVSRKIESDGERRRLKEILLSEKGEASGGFIVRTAASGASEEELRSDLRFLLNLWADIKQRSEASKSPALIYHDLNLVERILRDQVTDNFSAIWVDTESEYERVLRFLQRFQPSLIRRVKLYTKETPLFEQFGVNEEINKALRSKVWLKSGGSIVINQTEALVAIDINTGKYVGKTARLEDTIVKTNLDAIPEIVRQIRLRDLGGIIIIDFIDMDERKNRHKVMTVLEEELKKDRAPSKVLQFNDFGLVAITRKRVKQSLERTLSTTCGICAGTGMVKSAVTVCNDIYIEMRKMQKHLDRGDVMLRVNPEVVKQLKSPTARWLQEMEEMVGKTILIKSDPTLHPEQFDIH